MDINSNTNITSQITNSLSKLNLTTAKRTFEAHKEENKPEVELQDIKKDDIQLIDDKNVNKNAKKTSGNAIDVQEIQKYASYMGESLSIDDINYGLMYGRSVIADFSA